MPNETGDLKRQEEDFLSPSGIKSTHSYLIQIVVYILIKNNNLPDISLDMYSY